MRCPHCSGIEDKVFESRQNASGTVIRRRRECAVCGYRFTSYKHIEEKKLKVIKRDGRREPFDLRKLEVGIQQSLEKRPVSEEVIETMLHQTKDEAMLKTRSGLVLAASDLGDMVLRKLYAMYFIRSRYNEKNYLNSSSAGCYFNSCLCQR
ncbi:MAG: transcriptional repressor NrdR [Spirochaetales bacterium]|jgi:transcriptional repressor NrdR|nr:transcriptional repressor NrdR [Spirochaetales bacterium]